MSVRVWVYVAALLGGIVIFSFLLASGFYADTHDVHVQVGAPGSSSSSQNASITPIINHK